MKHAGSQDDLLDRRPEGPYQPPQLPQTPAGQSRTSLIGCFACLLFLVAIVADPAVRDLARALDPTAVHILRWVTGFGNSAYCLVIGLFLLGWLALARRWGADLPQKATRDFQSSLILLISAVAVSGVLASLIKHMIGRARPSIAPDVHVFDVSLFAFTPGLAAFPSGHATTGTACALVLAILFPRHAWAWLSIGAIAALSRAFLGVHWLTDCIAGVALGISVTLALHRWLTSRGHSFRMDPSVPLALARDARDQLIRRGDALLRRWRGTSRRSRRI
jgi:membrane-associated phospholipid phosphatase